MPRTPGPLTFHLSSFTSHITWSIDSLGLGVVVVNDYIAARHELYDFRDTFLHIDLVPLPRWFRARASRQTPVIPASLFQPLSSAQI